MPENISAEVVTVGTELVLGQLIDTNAAYIASTLSEIGVDLAYHTTVGDDPKQMADCFKIALNRCPIVITTGGIGPTEDDLTRQVWADVLGRELLFVPELWDQIQEMFKRAGFQLAENNRRQAFIPDGAQVVHNPRGTAPAFLYDDADNLIFCLPGVPRETEPLIREVALPEIEKKYNLSGQVIINRTLHIYGLGESNVDNQLKDIITSSENPSLGLQASQFETLVRLTARASSRQEAADLLDEREEDVRELVGEYIFATDDETLAGNIAFLLEKTNQSIAIADAFTRGAIVADLGRAIPPSLFKGAYVLDKYSDPDKLCDRLDDEFGADMLLAVAGQEIGGGRMQVDVVVLGRERDYQRSQNFGGGMDMALRRGGAMALFALYRTLRDGE